jgi:hypothetical protein
MQKLKTTNKQKEGMKIQQKQNNKKKKRRNSLREGKNE